MIRLILLFALLAPHLSPQDFRVRRVARAASADPPSWVQSWGNLGFSTTISTTSSGSVTSGRCVVCFLYWNSTSVTLSSATICGETATTLNNPTTIGYNGRSAWMYLASAPNGPCQASITLSDSAGGWIMCSEVSGANATPVEASTIASVSNPGSGTDAVTSGNISAGNNNLIIGASVETNSSTDAFSVGTGFTQRVSVTGGKMATKVQTTAGSVAATFTDTNGGNNVFAVGALAIKP